MATLTHGNRAFKRSVIVSVSVHLGLFIFLLISPYLPKPRNRGLVHYVNFVNMGGGGGQGGGGGAPAGGGPAPVTRTEDVAETQVPERQTLRDLTTPQKLQERAAPSMTHPVDKPKRGSKPKPKKTSSIQKSTQTPSKTKAKPSGSAGGSGTGPGVGIGVGPGSGGGGGGGLGIGFGPGYGSGSGFSNLPYAYYLQTLQARVSANWYTSQIRTGLTGDYHSIVRFRILRNGRISAPEIQESSGISTMDLSAIRAVRNASPFPPLPPEYDGDYMVIVLYFQHGKSP